MSDLIERRAAIEAFDFSFKVTGKENAEKVVEVLNLITERIKSLPSAQPELDEWCTDCKEYDKEHHRCPRWNCVIRNTVDELKAQQPVPQWIPCSERLPEEGQVVLTQAKFKHDIKFCVSSRQDFNYWTGWNTREINVVAWMPLPDPWKGDSK